YPKRELAAHLLGYVGLDNTGLNGLEVAYDSKIRGKSGKVLVQTDARRHVFSRFERPPTAGATIELTIDQYLQHVAERELHAGVVENRAAGGSTIILDRHTGGILAMANEPTFNPNAYREFDDAERLSRFIQRYGFGHPVSTDFPSESPGIVWRPEKWTDSALAHVAIGYQIAVIPLQMVAAVSAIATGGEYLEPRVIRAMYRDNR